MWSVLPKYKFKASLYVAPLLKGIYYYVQWKYVNLSSIALISSSFVDFVEVLEAIYVVD